MVLKCQNEMVKFKLIN